MRTAKLKCGDVYGGVTDYDRKWQACAARIAELLNVETPQVIFLETVNECDYEVDNICGLSAPENGIIFLIKNENLPITTFITLAHEMRHMWQRRNHSEWFEDYVHVESGDDPQFEAYRNQKSELDAEVFARWLCGEISGYDFFHTKEPDKAWLHKLLEHREEMALEEEQLSLESLEKFDELELF